LQNFVRVGFVYHIPTAAARIAKEEKAIKKKKAVEMVENG